MSNEAAPESPAEEVTRLRSCLNDLVSMTALPAVSTDGEPTHILSTLFDALFRTLRLAFVFVRLNDPDAGSSIEITRVAESFGGAAPAELFLASARVGLRGEIGLVVAGSERRDFPAPSDRVVLDIIHPDDLPSFESVIARGMTGENVTFAFRIVTSRGAVKHVRGVAHVVERVAGRPLFVGALQDVTESKEAEEALDRARSELARVARVTTVSALTASIAHEVNQPLSGIITNAGTCLRMLAADPPDVDGARETARRTLRDGNRASDVITRLRALFSKREFTLEPLDMNEVTREVVALSMSDLQRHRIVLSPSSPMNFL